MTEQADVKSCCVTGHIHEGTPTGTTQLLHGFQTYISNPKTPPTGKMDTIIMLPDIFGLYVNAKLLADEWAGQGYRVVLPDLTNGDPVPLTMLNTLAPNLREKAKATVVSKVVNMAKMGVTLGPWIYKHRGAVVLPPLEKFVLGIRGEPQTGKLAAIGFCWGGRYALLLAQEKSPARVDAVIANHPSAVDQADVKLIKSVPCAILVGTQDDLLSVDTLAEFEQIMKPNLGDKLLVKTYKDAVHGFTIRGDTKDAQEKRVKEEANSDAMTFLAKCFR